MSDFLSLPDLAAERLGGVAVFANDEFFAPRERLLRAAPPVWREGVYDEHGKWMDGWETRRRRDEGSDWCDIRLGLPGFVRGVVLDTSFFTGNYPESASIDATDVPGTPTPVELDRASWTTILPRSPLKGDARNVFAISDNHRWTHLRLRIHPDGGVARLRVHGEVAPDWSALQRAGGWVDLGALAHGGTVVSQSDAFYGNAGHMLLPGRATHMGDGWETRRRRGPGNDWAIVKLGRAGAIHRIELDTDHYRGNAPGACSVDGCPDDLLNDRSTWTTLLGRMPLLPHTRHVFEQEIAASGPVTHVRLNIFPDGGVARLRLFGSVAW
jgi:allantoicase